MAAMCGQNRTRGSPILRVPGESATESARDPAGIRHVGRRRGGDTQDAVRNGVRLGANHDVVDRVARPSWCGRVKGHAGPNRPMTGVGRPEVHMERMGRLCQGGA
jgi:hypothetical protein